MYMEEVKQEFSVISEEASIGPSFNTSQIEFSIDK